MDRPRAEGADQKTLSGIQNTGFYLSFRTDTEII